jgi:hypothetical protein
MKNLKAEQEEKDRAEVGKFESHVRGKSEAWVRVALPSHSIISFSLQVGLLRKNLPLP